MERQVTCAYIDKYT